MVKKNDKYIALNYDGITGSHYFDVVLNMYCRGLVAEEDINQFSEDIRQKLLFMKESRR
jgi:hypothetical protein